MKSEFLSNRSICFRRWSRKSYAVYSSMGKVIRIGVLSFFCLIISRPGICRQTTDTLVTESIYPPQELEEVVISAELSPVLQSGLMRVVRIISSQEIERSSAGSLSELLENSGAVDVRSRGAFGMQADATIRGGTFDQLMILLNGVNITDPQTGHHNLNIPLDLKSIKRIEILKGAGARLFGPSAFSGAINIVTHTPGKQPPVFSFEAGEYGYISGSLSGGLSRGKFRHFLSVNATSSEGFVENTDFKTANVYYRNETELPHFKLDAQAGFNTKAFGANSFYTPVYPDQFEEIQLGLFSLKLIPQGKIKLEPAFYRRRHYDRFELFRHQAPDWYSGHNYHMSDVTGLSLKWTQTWKTALTIIAAEYRTEQIYSTILGNILEEAVESSGLTYTHSCSRSGFSLTAEHKLFLGDFSVSGGSLLWVNPDIENGVSFFPGLDLSWQFNPRWRIFTSTNRSLRLPTFTDLFYSSPTITGNPGLLPEKAVSVEAGLQAKLSALGIEASVFRRWGKDLIDWVKFSEQEPWQSMNLTDVSFTGLEADLNFAPLQSTLVLKAGYSFLHADKSSEGFISYYVLDYLKHKAKLAIRFSSGSGWGISTDISYNDRNGGYMSYEEGEYSRFIEFDPFWLVDLRSFYRYDALEFYVSANNLLNKRVVNISNVPQPGRWIRAGFILNMKHN